MQVLHLVHFSWSMYATLPFSHTTAPTGQFLKQRPHFLHFSSFTLNWMSGVQTLAGQRFSLMCASYSSRKYLIVVRMGFGEVWPRPQSEESFTCWERSWSSSMSPSLPSPFVILARIVRSVLFPMRQGTHLPQDSSSVNSRKNFAMAGMQPPEGPPICTALNFRLPLMPPPMSKMMVLSGVPMGTSTRPMLFSAPERANTFVPLLFSVPRLANQSAPLRMMGGTLAKVSTLLSTDGRCQRPFTAGNGGFGLGMPRLPSMDAMSAVSSPQTNAPAPW